MAEHWFVDDAAYEARVEAEMAHLRRERERVAGLNTLLRGNALGAQKHPQFQAQVQRQSPEREQVQQRAQIVPSSSTPASATTAINQTLPARVETLSVKSNEAQTEALSESTIASRKQSADSHSKGDIIDVPSSPDEPLFRRHVLQAQKAQSSSSEQSTASNKATSRSVPKLNTTFTSEPRKFNTLQRFQAY